MADDLDILTSPEFADRCAEVAADLRAGKDISVEETARRLGLSEDFLITCAAAWTARQAGQPVLIMPAIDKDKAN